MATTQQPQRSQSAQKSSQKQQKEAADVKYLKPYLQKYKFNMKELMMLKKRYIKMSRNGILDRKSFMDSLGLLGLETADFLCQRIFEVIDEDGSNSCNFDEFLVYMNTLIYGSPREKAIQSFKMLDVEKKGMILKKDIEAMIRGVSQLWNSLTNSKVKPTEEYAQRIFNTFDVDGDGIVSFQDFEKVHDLSSDIFGWFEFFNQEDEENIRNDFRRSTYYGNGNTFMEIEFSPRRSNNDFERQNSGFIEDKFKYLESEISNVIKLVQVEHGKYQNELSRINKFDSMRSGLSSGKKLRISPEKRITQFDANEIDSPSKIKDSGSTLSSNQSPDTLSVTTKNTSPLKSSSIFKNYSPVKSKLITLTTPFVADLVNKKRNLNLGGPQFRAEGPVQAKETDENEDDIVFSPTSEEEEQNLDSPSKYSSPLMLPRAQSSYYSPFDYYGDSYYDGFSPEFEPQTSLLEINNKLSKLQDFLTDVKSSFTNKPDLAMSRTTSVRSPIKVVENEESREKMFESLFQANDPNQLIKLEEVKWEDESNNEENKSPSSKKNLQITTDTQAIKAGDQRHTTNVALMEGKEHRKNISVFFGHENWNLVLNMMIGLRTSIKNIEPRSEFEMLNESEFKLKSRYELVQKRTSGFDIRKACKFYDFFPHVFENIRKQYGINSNEFLKSCGPETLLGNLIIGNMSSLTELSSTGKSGSFFYFSEDGKYMLKTIPKREAVSLKRIIKDYYYHIMGNHNTLIARIFGLYKMKFYRTKKKHISIYFIVMGNLFNTELPIDVRYDLKGSTHGRTSKKKGVLPENKSIALKDLDFNEQNLFIELSPDDREMLKKQIELDAKFCANAKVIDYSLLLGIHYIKDENDPFAAPPPNYGGVGLTNPTVLPTPNFNGGVSLQGFSQPQLQLDSTAKPVKFYERYYGGMLSSDKKKIYILGIIDMLTEYTAKKRAETMFKGTLFGKGISCIPPQNYAERFKNYLFQKIK